MCSLANGATRIAVKNKIEIPSARAYTGSNERLSTIPSVKNITTIPPHKKPHVIEFRFDGSFVFVIFFLFFCASLFCASLFFFCASLLFSFSFVLRTFFLFFFCASLLFSLFGFRFFLSFFFFRFFLFVFFLSFFSFVFFFTGPKAENKTKTLSLKTKKKKRTE